MRASDHLELAKVKNGQQKRLQTRDRYVSHPMGLFMYYISLTATQGLGDFVATRNRSQRNEEALLELQQYADFQDELLKRITAQIDIDEAELSTTVMQEDLRVSRDPTSGHTGPLNFEVALRPRLSAAQRSVSEMQLSLPRVNKRQDRQPTQKGPPMKKGRI